METFAVYGHAIVSLVLFAGIVMALSPFAALKKQGAGLAPGATPGEDYADPAYRLHRAYLNGAETLPVFATVTLAAILTGVSPFWVNLLASLVLVTRLAMLVVHLRGIGKPHNGPRSFLYVAGWACMLVIGIMAIAGVLF